MKKSLYLFIASTILISCSSNNDDSSFDPVIGKWQLHSYSVNGEEQITECERKTTITFSENGKATTSSSFNDGNECMNETKVSTWENVGNSTYRIASNSEDAKLEFSENDTIFKASVTVIEDDKSYTRVITYKKI